MDESPGLVVWDETCNLKVVGSDPNIVYWMGIYHIISCKY